MNVLPNSESSFALLAECAVKITCLLGFAWIIASVSRRRSATFRHMVWSLGILGSLSLPLLTLLMPAWHSVSLWNVTQLLNLPHGMAANPVSGASSPMIVEATTAAPILNTLKTSVLLVWSFGFLFISTRLVIGIARLVRLSADSKPLSEAKWTNAVQEVCKRLKIARPVSVRLSGNHAVIPLTWGVFRPLIVLPALARDWPENRRYLVICHELAHVSRQDWFLLMCAEIARGFYWFHPFAWIAARHLRQESENACDDFVLGCGIEASDYAKQLLELARNLKNSNSAWSAALALTRPSNLERRLVSMLNPSVSRRPLSVRVRSASIFLGLCLLFPAAALRLPAQNLSARFSGTVYDPSGAPVPNATVIVTNRKTNKVDMTTSGAEGKFDFPDLTVGAYEMKVAKAGFAEYSAPEIALEPNRESSQNVILKVGSITEEVNVVAEGAKPAAGEGAGRKPARLRLGGEIQAPKLLNKVQPLYPATAKAAGAEGTVILHAVIGMDGTPLSLRVMNSQINPELAKAAVEAVSKWRYSPTLLNGEPIEVDTTIMVNFRLSS